MIMMLMIIIITSSHHHIMIIITLKCPTPYEQYVGWGNNINFICKRDQNFATPYEQYVDWSNDINFSFIATWSQTRRNVRVAANMLKQHGDDDTVIVIVDTVIVIDIVIDIVIVIVDDTVIVILTSYSYSYNMVIVLLPIVISCYISDLISPIGWSDPASRCLHLTSRGPTDRCPDRACRTERRTENLWDSYDIWFQIILGRIILMILPGKIKERHCAPTIRYWMIKGSQYQVILILNRKKTN